MQMAKHGKQRLHSLCKWQNTKNNACIAYANGKTKPTRQNIGTKERFPTQLLLPLHTAIQALPYWLAPSKGNVLQSNVAIYL